MIPAARVSAAIEVLADVATRRRPAADAMKHLAEDGLHFGSLHYGEWMVASVAIGHLLHCGGNQSYTLNGIRVVYHLLPYSHRWTAIG